METPSEQPSDTAPLVAHPVHYYEDGNLILVVENTKFRLWRSMLAHKSEVMKDMLSVPQAPQNDIATGKAAQEMIDGVPAITLTDDLKVFTILLDILMPQEPRLPTLKESILLYPILDKYAFETLRKYVISEVHSKLPFTFEDSIRLGVYDDLVFAVQVIQLARLMDDKTLLPLAFYALAVKDWGKDREMANRVLELLSRRDQMRIHTGKVALQDATMETFKQTIYFQDGSRCEDPRRGQMHSPSSGCPGIRIPREAVALLFKDPLLETFNQMHAERPSVCSHCTSRVRTTLQWRRAELFGQLRSIFEL